MPEFSEIQNIEGATSENNSMEWPSIDGEVTTDIEVTGSISVDGDIGGELTPEPEVVGYVSYEGADISGSIETVAQIMVPHALNHLLRTIQYQLLRINR